jgi:hypothetical protein
VLSGLAGYRTFRFFVAPSARPLLASLGFETVKESTSSWRSLPTTHTLWCRWTGERNGPAKLGEDSDYGAVPADLAEVRERTWRVIRARAAGEATARVHAANATSMSSSGNPLAPLLLLLEIADLLLPSLGPPRGRLDRLGDRALSRLPKRSVDWTLVGELFERFRDAVHDQSSPTALSLDQVAAGERT